MPAAANDLITLLQLKDQLKIAPATTTDDAIFQLWITAFSSFAEGYCSRKFVQQTIMGEIYDGDGERRLYLRQAPIFSFVNVDITQDVLYRLDPKSAFNPLETDKDYIFIKQGAPYYIELFRRAFYVGIQNIKVNYVVGYAAGDPVLQDMMLLTLEVLQDKYNKAKRFNDWLGRTSKSENQGGMNTSFSYKDLKPEFQATLNHYRRPMAGMGPETQGYLR
jgi:hypothetical protein